MTGILREARSPAEAAPLFAGMYGEDTAVSEQRLTRMCAGGWRLTVWPEGDSIIAFALWMDMVEYVFLRSFAVDPSRREGGRGRRFFEALRVEAWPSGRQIRLEVAPDGPRAFWERLGLRMKSTGMWLPEGAA